MRRFSKLGLVAGAVLLLFAGVSSPALAAPSGLDDYDIQSFHSDYTLTQDAEGRAHLHVVETIVAVYPDFDQNKGFFRDIPEYRHGVQLHTVLDSVVDEYGQRVPHTTEYYEDFFSVGLGDDTYVHGRQTYVITYDQVDVVESFADTGADELYWDVNGTGWAQPFGEASMSLRIDPSIVPTLSGDSACYVLTGECTDPLVQHPNDDGSVTFTAGSTNLSANDSLTFSIGFTAGTFTPGEVVVAPPTSNGGGTQYVDPPEYPASPWWEMFAPFVLGGTAIVSRLIASATRGAGGPGKFGPSGTIIAQYTPPKDLNVMVAAYLVGEPTRAFAAQIISLAVRRKVRLLDNKEKGVPFAVELLDATGLDAIETQLVTAMFGAQPAPGIRITLGGTNTTLGSKIEPVYKSVKAQLTGAGIQGGSRPTALWVVLFVITLLATLAAGIDTLRRLVNDDLGFSWIGLGFAVFSLGSVWAHRATIALLTPRGHELNDQLLGLKEYLHLAEEDRIRMLQSPEGAERINVDDTTQMVKFYERLLPYAVIFGVEDKWSNELSVRAAAANVPVEWWSGSSQFSGWQLNSTIQNLRLRTPQVPKPIVAQSLASSDNFWKGGWGTGGSSSGWSGSSGSSFSGGSHGGGFSGGGGGGGGGRGR
ncbi:MAG: DUF2207 domain-containing protein [Pseudolysinimonas sp.]|uniref:DUF2207 domain-containing protein n=1 Tax=Pseudolysinimonas sp. TaxID=2680009 RepID=UPI003264C347